MTGRQARLRPRLSRTLSRARWEEFEVLLGAALDHGYAVRPLEDWLDDPG